jgi:zinc protease
MTRHRISLGLALAAVLLVVAAERLESRVAARSAPPPAAPADTLVSMYDVGGVSVIQRRTPAGEIVALRVYLLGGSRQVDATNAGIEPLMLIASEYGTKSYPGNATRSAQSRTGSAVVVGTEADWTTLEFVGLAEDFDSTWAVVADRLVHPTLDSATIAIAKQRTLVAARARVDGPDGIVRQIAESLAFAGHPYRNPTGGTIASLTAITPAMVRAYHAANMVTSRLLVVVAGNVSRAQVENAVKRTLATLPAGTYKWSLPERWQPKATAIAVRSQQLPTNYIVGMFGGPIASSREVIALQEGLGIIGGRMYGPMRDSGLTYAAGAGFLSRGASGGMIMVSTGSPDRAHKIINESIELMVGSFPAPTTMFNTQNWEKQYLSAIETAASTVDLLGDSYLYHGDFRYFENFGNELRQLGAGDVSRAVRAYVKNIQWAYLGDTLKLPRAAMMKY